MSELRSLSEALAGLGLLPTALKPALADAVERNDAERWFALLSVGDPAAMTGFQVKQLRKLSAFGLDDVRKALFLGDYLLLGKLGQGGMGAVYKAKHPDRAEPVALKRIKAETAILRKRLKTEFKAMMRVQNELAGLPFPPIVRALELFKHGKSEVLVMEYQNLGDLEHHARTDARPGWERVARWAAELLTGLEIAHARNIIHRDIKPSNVMLHRTVDRTVIRLADWGLAKMLDSADESTQATRAGQLLGSIHYMPPEQWRGVRNIEVASDLYTLGGTLFFALVGRPPFSRGAGDTMPALCSAHANEAPPSVRAAGRSDVPPAMDELIRRMLAKHPAARGKAGELRELFRGLLKRGGAAPRPVPVPPPPMPPPMPMPVAADELDGGSAAFKLIESYDDRIPPSRRESENPQRPKRERPTTTAKAVKPLSPEELRVAKAAEILPTTAFVEFLRLLRRYLVAPAGQLGLAAKDDFDAAGFTLLYSGVAWLKSLASPGRYWSRWLLVVVAIGLMIAFARYVAFR